MHPLALALLVAVALSCGQGCATIISGSTEQVAVTSEPPGAKVTVSGRTIITPGTVELRTDDAHTFYAELDGYQPTQATISTSLNVVTLANIVCTGALGIVVDAVTGAISELDEDSVHLVFTERRAPTAGGAAPGR